MSVGALTRTSAFRLALFYSGIYSLSALVLLAFAYWLTLGFIGQQSDDSIRLEYRGIAELYRGQGLAPLVAAIEERVGEKGIYVYLLVDSRSHRVAGNLQAWPGVAAPQEGWLDFAIESHKADREMQDMRALTGTLPDGFRLLVGRNIHDLKESRELILASLGWIIAVMVVLGLLGGWIVGRKVMRRVDVINRTTREIIRGDLHARMPTNSRGDEFDQMSENVNIMLDRIEHLMNGMRQVSDGIAHDLRTPLTRLHSRLELALLGKNNTDQDRAAIEDALAETESLLATFNALLNIARAEAGSARKNVVSVDVVSMVRDVADLYEPAAQAKGITLRVELESHPLSLQGDRQLLAQALVNLVDNAIKFTPAGGEVTLNVKRIGNDVEIAIADNGAGIPAAERDAAVQRFVRLDNAKDVPGSGLGLSLVAAVARLHDGELRLEDNGPGLRAVLRLDRTTRAQPSPGADAQARAAQA